MHDPWTDRLSEYLDGELAATESEALEAHLAVCDPCRETLVELTTVVERARSLPVREPATDLWPAIAAGIGGRRGAAVTPLRPRRERRFSFTMPQLAAAALVLMALSGGAAWMLRPATPVPTAPVTVAGGAGPAVLRASGAPLEPVSYDNAIRELQQVLRDHGGQLDSSTVRVLTENLALIDRAIAQARAALEADPNDEYLSEHLAETMRRKLELLRRAASLTASAT
jgi:anti-sigma factor RsiW